MENLLVRIYSMCDMMEFTSQPFAAGGQDGRMIICNTAFCDLIGYPKVELMNMPGDTNLNPPEWSTYEAKVLKELRQTGKPQRYEKEYIRKDGTRVPVELLMHLAVDPNSKALFYYSFITDISERKRAEDRLKGNEARFRSLLDNSSDVIYRVNVQTGLYEYISPSAETVMGYTPSELMSMDAETWLSMIHPEDLPAMNAALACLQDTGRREVVYRQLTKNGEYRWISNKMLMVLDSATDKPLFREGNIRDITRHRQAENALYEIESQFRALTQNLKSGVTLIDETGRFKIVNQAFLQIFGLKHDLDILNVNGQDWSRWAVYGEDCNPLTIDEHPDQKAMMTGKPVRNRLVAVRNPGEKELKWMLISAEPMLKEDGSINMVICTYHEVTDLKNAEKEFLESKQQSELYLDLMGHDINNFNHSAMGYLEIALEILETDKHLHREDKMLLERPIGALADSTALIDNVRKLQKLTAQGIKTVPIDLQTIFAGLESIKVYTHQERDIIILIQPISSIIVEANDLLRDVFINLISNAINHSDEEKPLTIRVRIESPIETDGEFCRCTVEDNGPGIPDELKGKIFDRFHRGTTKAKGKGLGLHLVKMLVEGYHGKVWVEDRVKGDHRQGSRFIVLLPAAQIIDK